MSTIRRVYVYLLSFAGLMMLLSGAGNLGRVIVEVLLADPRTTSASYVRDEVARSGAAALVGLPVWLLHWWWAQRLAASSPAERSSTLRRLHVYAVLAVAMATLAVAVETALEAVFEARPSLEDAVAPLPIAAVALVAWLFAWQVAAADRAAVGEQGGSATLRRWYVYGLAFVGLLVLLSGVRQLVEDVWGTLLGSQSAVDVTRGVPGSVVGLGLWVGHWGVLGTSFRSLDRQATLRSVYLFLSLAVVVTGALSGLSQLLYYGLGRALGVATPGGVGGSLIRAAAGPVSTTLVYGAGWGYAWTAVRAQARLAEGPHQAGSPSRPLGRDGFPGVRRLYTYLVALIALSALTAGVGGLLWLLGDALTNPSSTASGDWWRDRVALFATLIIVGLPVWALHWRPSARVAAEEAGALSRRLYVYLALIAGSLVLLVSLAMAAYQLLTLALGAPATGSLTTDLAHDLADVVVAAAVIGYHWGALRTDARAAAHLVPVEGPTRSLDGAEAVVRLRASDVETLALALDGLRERGLDVEALSAPSPLARTSPPDD